LRLFSSAESGIVLKVLANVSYP